MDTKRMNYIQGLRGYAIFLIVLWHLNSIFPQNLPSTGDKGVEFFFLISGFLVAYKYLDNDKLSNCRQCIFYAINKVKKLYPLYLLSIIPMLFLDLRLVIKNASGGQTYRQINQ